MSVRASTQKANRRTEGRHGLWKALAVVAFFGAGLAGLGYVGTHPGSPAQSSSAGAGPISASDASTTTMPATTVVTDALGSALAEIGVADTAVTRDTLRALAEGIEDVLRDMPEDPTCVANTDYVSGFFFDNLDSTAGLTRDQFKYVFIIAANQYGGEEWDDLVLRCG